MHGAAPRVLLKTAHYTPASTLAVDCQSDAMEKESLVEKPPTYGGATIIVQRPQVYL